MRIILAAVVIVGCTADPQPESSSGNEEVPSYAMWRLQTRVRLPESDAWVELDPATSSSPFTSDVTVSGGHDIGQLGRWVGCDFSVAGATGTISCTDLTTRNSATMSANCPTEGSTLRFARADADGGELEIRIECTTR